MAEFGWLESEWRRLYSCIICTVKVVSLDYEHTFTRQSKIVCTAQISLDEHVSQTLAHVQIRNKVGGAGKVQHQRPLRGVFTSDRIPY